MARAGYMGFILIIGILGATLVLGSSIPLAPVQICEARITVLDMSENPINNAVVQFDLVSGLFEPRGDVDYQGQTNSYGVLTITVSTGDYYLKVIHPQYETYETALVPFKDYNIAYTFKLVLSGSPTPGYAASFFMRDSSNDPFQWSKAIFGGQEYVADSEGVIIVFGVEQGTHSIQFRSHNALNPFAYTISFTMPARDASFTFNVDSGVLTTGDPPINPPELEDFLTLPMVILIGIGFFGIMILFRGRGPELVRMMGGRR